MILLPDEVCVDCGYGGKPATLYRDKSGRVRCNDEAWCQVRQLRAKNSTAETHMATLELEHERTKQLVLMRDAARAEAVEAEHGLQREATKQSRERTKQMAASSLLAAVAIVVIGLLPRLAADVAQVVVVTVVAAGVVDIVRGFLLLRRRRP